MYDTIIAIKCSTRRNDGERMPRNPSVAPSAQNSVGAGRIMCELRAEFGCTSGQLRGQAVFVEEGQVEHELRDGMLRQLGGGTTLALETDVAGRTTFAANANLKGISEAACSQGYSTRFKVVAATPLNVSREVVATKDTKKRSRQRPGKAFFKSFVPCS